MNTKTPSETKTPSLRKQLDEARENARETQRKTDELFLSMSLQLEDALVQRDAAIARATELSRELDWYVKAYDGKIQAHRECAGARAAIEQWNQKVAEKAIYASELERERAQLLAKIKEMEPHRIIVAVRNERGNAEGVCQGCYRQPCECLPNDCNCDPLS